MTENGFDCVKTQARRAQRRKPLVVRCCLNAENRKRLPKRRELALCEQALILHNIKTTAIRRSLSWSAANMLFMDS